MATGEEKKKDHCQCRLWQKKFFVLLPQIRNLISLILIRSTLEPVHNRADFFSSFLSERIREKYSLCRILYVTISGVAEKNNYDISKLWNSQCIKKYENACSKNCQLLLI
jgi:hypothetical protein